MALVTVVPAGSGPTVNRTYERMVSRLLVPAISETFLPKRNVGRAEDTYVSSLAATVTVLVLVVVFVVVVLVVVVDAAAAGSAPAKTVEAATVSPVRPATVRPVE